MERQGRKTQTMDDRLADSAPHAGYRYSHRGSPTPSVRKPDGHPLPSQPRQRIPRLRVIRQNPCPPLRGERGSLCGPATIEARASAGRTWDIPRLGVGYAVARGEESRGEEAERQPDFAEATSGKRPGTADCADYADGPPAAEGITDPISHISDNGRGWEEQGGRGGGGGMGIPPHSTATAGRYGTADGARAGGDLCDIMGR